MKREYSFITAFSLILLLSVIYYVIPKTAPAFEDMQPRVVELPEFTVTGFEIYGNLEKNNYSKAWQKISNEEHFIDASCQGDFSYGIELYQKEAKAKWHYLAGCEMLDPLDFSEKMGVELSTRVIPKNRYVVFTYNGEITLKRMGALYSYIFKEWLPQNGYQPAGYYNFERYDDRFRGAKEARSEFELFVPIR